MLVHPKTGEIVLITKEKHGPNLVYRVPSPLDSQTTATLEQVAVLDVNSGSPERDKVTDAAVATDARRVAVRTYAQALELDLAEGASLASVWSTPPRATPLDDGGKGEGITYRTDGQALMTIGESSAPSLFRTPLEC